MRWSNEPVILSSLVAGVLVTAATVLSILDAGGTMLHAAAVGLLELAAVLGGGALARQSAYGPRSVDEILDADAVISAAEQG